MKQHQLQLINNVWQWLQYSIVAFNLKNSNLQIFLSASIWRMSSTLRTILCFTFKGIKDKTTVEMKLVKIRTLKVENVLEIITINVHSLITSYSSSIDIRGLHCKYSVHLKWLDFNTFGKKRVRLYKCDDRTHWTQYWMWYWKSSYLAIVYLLLIYVLFYWQVAMINNIHLNITTSIIHQLSGNLSVLALHSYVNWLIASATLNLLQYFWVGLKTNLLQSVMK